MRAFVTKSYIVLFLLLLFTACTKKQAVVSRPAFSAGPRVPNSKAHNDCAVWFIQTLRAQGATVELQRGQMPDDRGNMQQIYNIIAHFSTPETASRPRVLLGAHYDTRPWCDEEEQYSDRFYNVPGANDGAAGVGVLLEIGRQLGLRIADSTLRTPVDIVLFDCEDMGTPRFYTGQEREDTWCLGSQLWATNYAKQVSSLERVKSSARSDVQRTSVEHTGGVAYSFGIVLDMVGAPDAVFPRELYSTQYASNYQQQIWRAAEQLGYGAMFSSQQSYPITDDHYYVNYIAGIPCVDIIHYDIRNATGFPHWWHTRNDDLSNISKSTLQAVGEVVMSQL